LRIIPVIDILDGIVVHAVKGQRSKYQPLKSQICNSTDPLKVALAFREFDFKSLYIADLNAIMRKGNNSAAIKEIATRTGLELMVDSGTNRLQQIQELIDNKISKVIIGTETLLTINFVKEAISSFGTDKLVLSLDLKNGKVLGKFENANILDSIMLAKKLEELQVSEVIVLDLARVGSQEGVDFD
jgi:phosphoribosylformimino-5-aminoimidazole carboxamide ribotide isomerase